MYEMMTDMGQPERSQLLAAIKSLLASQRSSLKEKIEVLRRHDPRLDPPKPFKTKPEYEHLDVFGYNIALDDVLSLLKED
jgi:hypothetical protein